MDPNALPSGIYANVQPGTVGLEMSLHHQMPQQSRTMMSYPHHEADHYQQQPSYSIAASKPKTRPLTLSDDDEPAGGGYTPENSADDDKRKTTTSSPWQRMKWTDNMVRLLIMVVYYIGDEVVSDDNPSGKKKAGIGGGVLQKKGKWKSVSRAMMERGFYVSPQQCEDKFNDLNKRYKRVNDILGKGTACRVVENQSLLDSMDHLSPKTKEEVKKLLNSKHLFFREMCAYHNSCGHNVGASSNVHNNSPQETIAEPSHAAHTQQKKSCSHSKENPGIPQNLTRVENEHDEEDEDEDDGEDDEEDDDDDDDDEEDGGHDEFMDERSSKKRMRDTKYISPLIQQLDVELSKIMHDSTKSALEKREWIRSKMMVLDEQRVGIQSQAYDIEKQRLKWFKFSSEKEREVERERLTNERLKLENERMVLLIRQKELDLIDHHQQQDSSN